VALEGLGQGMEEISALLAQGVEVRADDAEGLSAPEGAKAAGDLLLDLGHAHGLFGEVIGEGTPGWVMKYLEGEAGSPPLSYGSPWRYPGKRHPHFSRGSLARHFWAGIAAC
jgi:hypothetical protein